MFSAFKGSSAGEIGQVPFQVFILVPGELSPAGSYPPVPLVHDPVHVIVVHESARKAIPRH